MTKKRNVSETVAVMPVAISQMPMSEDVDAPTNVSSRQRNSQHDEPIWKDLQSGGGVQRTARHALAWPFSHMHNLHISTPGGTKCIACWIVRPV
jgi:hypothetical protein